MSDTPETDAAFLAAVHAISQDPKAAARMMGDYIRQRDELAAALRELVRLKDMHDKIESYGNPVFEGVGAMANEYKARKPIAWDNARALLARIEEGK